MARQMVWMIGLTFKLDLSYGYSDLEQFFGWSDSGRVIPTFLLPINPVFSAPGMETYPAWGNMKKPAWDGAPTACAGNHQTPPPPPWPPLALNVLGVTSATSTLWGQYPSLLPFSSTLQAHH